MGQIVYRRNFSQSKAVEHYNSKLANKFEKARIKAKHGTCYYDLEDMNGKYLGNFHAKDIRS